MEGPSWNGRPKLKNSLGENLKPFEQTMVGSIRPPNLRTTSKQRECVMNAQCPRHRNKTV